MTLKIMREANFMTKHRKTLNVQAKEDFEQGMIELFKVQV